MSFLDFLADIEPISRKHYGRDKTCPPDLPKDDYYWDNNNFSHTYGWNESDDSLRKRFKKKLNEKKDI